MLLFHSIVAAWILTVFIGAAVCVAYSLIITIFSDLVSPEEQGWVMGVTGAIMALCFGLTSFLTGIIVEAGADWSMILSVAGLVLAGMLLVFVKAR